MKVIYIAGPFRGPNAWEVEKNIRRAEELAFQVNSLGGCIALCPHTNTRFFNGTLTDEFWLEGTKELFLRCDAAMFTIDWPRSLGSRAELQLARTLFIPCFSDTGDLKDWLTKLRAVPRYIAHEREVFTVDASEVGSVEMVLK